MINIQNLTKLYRHQKTAALRDVNLTIGKGMYGLLGPNGAGKTTLMRILATLLKPSSGEVMINDCSIREPEQIRSMIGYLPQYFQLYPQMTGIELLEYAAGMKGIQPTQWKSHIDSLLEQVNLKDKAKDKIKTYSGGMKQRLGIAQALLGHPDVLIVDEPTAGLDPEERLRFRNLLGSFSKGRIVLLSTHIVADIESSCEHAAVLNKGQVAFSGSLKELEELAQNKVWEVFYTQEEFLCLNPAKIAQSRRYGEGYLCRVVSLAPPKPDAIPQKPNLREGYLALLGEHSYE